MVIAAVSSTMAERLEELGHISADRLRLSPPPGTATVDDLIDQHATSNCVPVNASMHGHH